MTNVMVLPVQPVVVTVIEPVAAAKQVTLVLEEETKLGGGGGVSKFFSKAAKTPQFELKVDGKFGAVPFPLFPNIGIQKENATMPKQGMIAFNRISKKDWLTKIVVKRTSCKCVGKESTTGLKRGRRLLGSAGFVRKIQG